MTQDQFAIEVERLQKVFGKENWPDVKVDVLWRSVEQMNYSWFRRMIENQLLLPLHKVNLQEHISAEKRRLAMEHQVDKLMEDERINKNFRSDDGLQKVLDKLGTSNLIDAIEKLRDNAKKISD
jgi:hypothetical protein